MQTYQRLRVSRASFACNMAMAAHTCLGNGSGSQKGAKTREKESSSMCC